MKFNKVKCLEMIYSKAREKNISIGDIEQAAEVSKGYLSRLNKEDNSAPLTVDFVLAVAEKLGISVAELLYINYNLRPSEELLKKFIDKLCEDTYKESIEWMIEEFETNDNDSCSLSYVSKRLFVADRICDYSVSINERTLHLYEVVYDTPEKINDGTATTSTELYWVTNDGICSIGTTYDMCNEIVNSINQLKQAIRSSQTGISLDENDIEFMIDYLNVQ